MASTSKLAALIVTVVIVAPILVGFLMPSGMVTQVGYETERTTDITSDIATDHIPNFAPYSGSFNQNPLLNVDGTPSTTAIPVGATTSPNSMGFWRSAVEGSQVIAQGAFSPSLNGYDMVFIRADSPIFQSGSNNFEGLLVYSDFIWGYNAPTIMPDGYTLLDSPIVSTQSTTVDTFSVFYGDIDTPSGLIPAYMDIALGYTVPDQDAIWSNSFLNEKVEIILHSYQGVNNTVNLILDGVAVSVSWLDGLITADVAGTEATIGRWTAYPYIGVIFDASNDTITITGMSGMRGFLDYTVANRTNALEVPASISAIRTFIISDTMDDGDGTSFLVTSASVQISTIVGVQNGAIDPSDYYPDDLWQISIQSPAVYGSTMTLGPTTYNISTDGKIQGIGLMRDGVTEIYDLPVRDLTIASFPNSETGGNDIFINGYFWGNVQSLPITFGGNWLFSLLISDLDAFSYTEYVWNPGSFNIDVVGFCMVGLIASFAAFIATALIGRRSGVKAALLLLVSAICAGFYIMIMEGAL